MARNSPTELYHAVLRMHRHGHSLEQIADQLGLESGCVRRWVSNPKLPTRRASTHTRSLPALSR